MPRRFVYACLWLWSFIVTTSILNTHCHSAVHPKVSYAICR